MGEAVTESSLGRLREERVLLIVVHTSTSGVMDDTVISIDEVGWSEAAAFVGILDHIAGIVTDGSS